MYLPGLALPILAALIPQHWKVKIITEIIEDVDFDEECDLVGLGAMGYSVFRAVDIAKEFKKRGRIIFMGGIMASYLPESMKRYIDGVVVGAAEISFPKLLLDFESTGKIQKYYNNPLENLSGLPVPKYEYFPRKKIRLMLPVQASRGCPHICSFCSTSAFYKGNYSVRPVDEVINDINRVKKLGYRRFFLLDDNMAGNAAHIEELALKLIPLKMSWAGQCTINFAHNDRLLRLVAKSGCKILSVGMESVTQEGLNLLNKAWLKTDMTSALLKKIRAAGIIVFSSILIGTDSDTEESIRQTASFIIKNKIAIPVFNILTPLPGTELYFKLKQENRLLSEDISKYTGFKCVHEPKNISAGKTDTMFWWIYNEVYSVKNILKRNLFVRNSITKPWLCLFSLYINFHYRKYIKKGIGPLIV
jgi:radical SAM superfamily enzyme YgiQ (UPF0313 family)